jgi:hypothetical protein
MNGADAKPVSRRYAVAFSSVMSILNVSSGAKAVLRPVIPAVFRLQARPSHVKKKGGIFGVIAKALIHRGSGCFSLQRETHPEESVGASASARHHDRRTQATELRERPACRSITAKTPGVCVISGMLMVCHPLRTMIVAGASPRTNP